jgi:hypothetical protein
MAKDPQTAHCKSCQTSVEPVDWQGIWALWQPKREKGGLLFFLVLDLLLFDPTKPQNPETN